MEGDKESGAIAKSEWTKNMKKEEKIETYIEVGKWDTRKMPASCMNRGEQYACKKSSKYVVTPKQLILVLKTSQEGKTNVKNEGAFARLVNVLKSITIMYLIKLTKPIGINLCFNASTHYRSFFHLITIQITIRISSYSVSLIHTIISRKNKQHPISNYFL